MSTPVPANSPSVKSPAYAEFAGRVGRYVGNAYNNTARAQGNVVMDITSINPATGAVSVRMAFSGYLCGVGSSSGKISQQGAMTLAGTLSCSMSFRMFTRCNFSGPERLNCAYGLSNRAAGPLAKQAGVFEAVKQGR
jgi:hypothetical protein